MSAEQISWVVQGSDAVVVNTSPGRIWRILQNSQMLPEWMPAVKSTDGQRETMGAVRNCEVNFDGREGRVVERCVVYEEPLRIGWLLVEDSLGFSKMLKHFTFDFVLEPLGPEKTRIINTSYFEPRNWFARMMIALMMRKKFRSLRQRLLFNIKRLAETANA